MVYNWRSLFQQLILKRKLHHIEYISAVFRIHLILMRIRILDQHWKKKDMNLNLDPDPDLFILFTSLIFMLRIDEPFKNQDIFIIYFFSIVKIWV